MPGPGVFFGSPVATGTTIVSQGAVTPGALVNGPPISDYGISVLMQRAQINSSGTNAASCTFQVPYGSCISDFLIDVLFPFNSATSAILSAGTSAGGTQYLSGVDVKAGSGRVAVTHTNTQISAMGNVGANTNVVVTVTPTGATSTGAVNVTLRYAQTIQNNQGAL